MKMCLARAPQRTARFPILFATGTIFLLTRKRVLSGTASISETLRLRRGVEVGHIHFELWLMGARSLGSRLSRYIVALIDGRSVSRLCALGSIHAKISWMQ
jgi:hypothetical protein